MKLKVTTPNRMLIINNIPVRTPCEIKIKNKMELEYMKMYLRTECANYEVIEENKFENTPEVTVKSIKKTPVEEKPYIEETIDEEVIKSLNEAVTTEDDEPLIEELYDKKESGRILDEILIKN